MIFSFPNPLYLCSSPLVKSTTIYLLAQVKNPGDSFDSSFSKPTYQIYSSLLLSVVSLSAVSVTSGQLQSENITWKTPETNNSQVLNCALFKSSDDISHSPAAAQDVTHPFVQHIDAVYINTTCPLSHLVAISTQTETTFI